ncbi:hypothetical protein [Nostoc sp. TCL26-01]|uniref:hypothetical protein n=1 Tax=Nostoc sp. TCL26-01 TaxID=2576904 RepID=UPI0015BDD825|nr:hypothetical protein [Nostoc sp. TCL26-01]
MTNDHLLFADCDRYICVPSDIIEVKSGFLDNNETNSVYLSRYGWCFNWMH